MKRLAPRVLAARIAPSASLAAVFLLACCTIPFRAAASSLAFTTLQESSEPSARESKAEPAQKSHEAAGENEEEQFKHSSSVRLFAKLTGLSLESAYWLSVVLNFAIVAVIIFWAMKKNLPAMFRKRTAFIQQAMEEARKASEDANRRLGEIEARLSKLGVEIGQMRAVAEKESAEEEQRIKAAAEEDARKIVESAEQEIAAAAKSARHELTAYAADLAVALAAKQIHVDTNTDQALVKDFVRQLPDNGGERRKGNQ
jgi:F-type H+-transporting ATPase subunit b